MAIKIEMLRCFTVVAKCGGLSEAANVLGRTPSAVSMMLKQFEDHVGAPLFETARKSHLTAIGHLIYEEARREVAHFENTISVIDGLAQSELGYLRLAVTPSIATSVLPPVILRFVTKYPKVQIEIRDMDSASISRELARERADIGIGTLDMQTGMNSRELFRDPFGVVCRTDHPLAQDWDKLTWRDMHGFALIANGLCDLILDPDFAPILAASRLTVPNTVSLLGLVREGVGITVLPRLAVTGLQDDIAFLPLTDVTAQRSVQIVSQPLTKLMPAASAFLDLMTEMAEGDALVTGN